MGPAARVREAFKALRQSMSGIGLEVNKAKCATWDPLCPARGFIPDGDPLGGMPCVAFVQVSGLKVLGVPVERPEKVDMHDRLWAKRIEDLQSGVTPCQRSLTHRSNIVSFASASMWQRCNSF